MLDPIIKTVKLYKPWAMAIEWSLLSLTKIEARKIPIAKVPKNPASP